MPGGAAWWWEGDGNALPFPKAFAASVADDGRPTHSREAVQRRVAAAGGSQRRKEFWWGTAGPWKTAKDLKEGLLDHWEHAYPQLDAAGGWPSCPTSMQRVGVGV